MNKKLSELSKPVATVDVQRGRQDGNIFAVAWSSAGHALPDGPHFTYSQEYVSALDKVAQFWIGESAEWKQRAEDAEKRIAELEAIATEYAGKFQKAQDAAKHLIIMNDSAQAEIAHLKTLLATPVRLSELCGDGENDNEYTEGLNDGINQSAKAIRAAGFTVEGYE